MKQTNKTDSNVKKEWGFLSCPSCERSFLIEAQPRLGIEKAEVYLLPEGCECPREYYITIEHFSPVNSTELSPEELYPEGAEFLGHLRDVAGMSEIPISEYGASFWKELGTAMACPVCKKKGLVYLGSPGAKWCEGVKRLSRGKK